MKGKSELPYLYRDMSQAGKYHGTGIAAQIGKKKGTFTDVKRKENPLKDMPVPRKMN